LVQIELNLGLTHSEYVNFSNSNDVYFLSAGRMVFVAGGLIPARFLTLISHLTIVIVILWSRVSYGISSQCSN
jgi:hypothetical protein